jgi:hypothetical protein
MTLEPIEVLSFWKLCDELYEKPLCGAGGPLHVILDDFNVEDEFLSYENDGYYSNEIYNLSDKILNKFRLMSYSDRFSVVRGPLDRQICDEENCGDLAYNIIKEKEYDKYICFRHRGKLSSSIPIFLVYLSDGSFRST